MNLIVFDLEWNQSPTGKADGLPDLPFEIIEIGAVKLNEQREILDTFHVLIRPVAYRRLHPAINDVVALSMRDLMKQGIPFARAAKQFLQWCGEDYRFCTWGTLDLLELQKNLKWYRMEELLTGPILYEDVQKLFAISFENRKERRALNWAVEYLQIPEDRRYHLALDDAWYTALVLQRLPDSVIWDNYSIDTYQNPKSRTEEIRLHYLTYDKFISKEFESKDLLMEDRLVSEVRCFCCQKQVKRIVRWFSNGGKNYLAVGRCEEHGFVKSKVRVRKTDQERFYAVKTTKMINEDDVERVRQKRGRLRIKRQLKRQRN